MQNELFAPTHNWIHDGTVIPVILNGGEVYDATTFGAQHNSGIAQYDADDYDADGEAVLVVTLHGKLCGRLVRR